MLSDWELQVCQPQAGKKKPISGLGPKTEQNGPNMDVGLSGQKRETGPQVGNIATKEKPNIHFVPFSLFLGLFFLLLPGGAKIHFSSHFFPISGRTPEIDFLPGRQPRKLRGERVEKIAASIDAYGDDDEEIEGS